MPRQRSLRRLTGLCLLVTAVPMTLGASGASASGSSGGTFLTPFREDGAHYNAATDTFSGGFAKGSPTDKYGCVTKSTSATGAPAGNSSAYDCLPAGASMVQLANGKTVFWNALEGEEAIGGTQTLLLNGGQLTVNDESRLLDLTKGTPVYAIPGNQTGGAHQTGHPDDLPLGPFSAEHYDYNNGDMFCSDQVFLGNGDVIDAGGTDYYSEPYVPAINSGLIELQGVKNSRIYDATANRWALGPTMNYGRWYPSLVTQGNGEIFVASGVDKLLKPVYPTRPTESGTNVEETETLTIGAKKPVWVANPTATANKSLPLFPRLHLLPDGHVYYDAAGQDFNPFGQSVDEALWELASSYDPTTKTWTDLGVPGAQADYLAKNPAAAPYVGFRGSTFSAALEMRPSSVTGGVPTYDSASYLTAGGVLGVSPGSYAAVANSRITSVSTKGGTEKLSTVGTKPLTQARWYGTATPLPNGQVYVSSGANVDEVVLPGLESPILSTELFTPTVDSNGTYTGGTWAKAGDQARKRTYHNDALLQPDGSVLIGGNAPISTGYAQTIDTPNLPGRLGTDNHHDASFQIWEPPYFNDPARPVVQGLSTSGRTVVVHTADAAHIASVVLMRNTAETHLVDADARTVALPVLSRGTDTVTVGLPSTTNVLPNGPYMLFANKSKTADLSGRNAADLLPSVAKQVFITGTKTPSVLVPSEARYVAPKVVALTAQQRAAGIREVVTPQGVALVRVVAVPKGSKAAATPTSLDLVANRQDQHEQVPAALGLVGALLVGSAATGVYRLRRRSVRP